MPCTWCIAACGFALWLGVGCRPLPVTPTPTLSDERAQLAADVSMLASPAFEGRGVGTRGLDRAADYLVSRFSAIGLKPITPGGIFRQPFTAPSTRPATTQPTPIANIVGLCVGERANEFVIVGAHYDHLGFGGHGSATPWSHEMHPGADDNASGTSAILALAWRFAMGPKPRRSILFVCFAGEERGLLGSEYFVHHPPIDLTHVVAMVNLDMIGRLREDRVYVGGEKTADAFTQLVREADRAPSLELKTFSLGGGGPSDHLTFSRQRIPVLFFFTGLHADYHTPRDQAQTVNLDGEQRIVQLVAGCIDRLTRLPRPAYRDADDHDATILSPPPNRLKMTLGLTLRATDRNLGGQIGDIQRDSPAMGMVQINDRLLAVDGKAVQTTDDLQNALRFSMPGDEVRLTIQHAGQTRIQPVYLGEPKE